MFLEDINVLYQFYSKDRFTVSRGNYIPLSLSKGKMLIRIWDFKREVSKNRVASNTSVMKGQSRKEERERSVSCKCFDKVSLYSCAFCSLQIAVIFLEVGLSVYLVYGQCTMVGVGGVGVGCRGLGLSPQIEYESAEITAWEEQL